MIEIGKLYRLKNNHADFAFYNIQYVIITDLNDSFIIYRSVEEIDMQYTAQYCDFIELYELWNI